MRIAEFSTPVETLAAQKVSRSVKLDVLEARLTLFMREARALNDRLWSGEISPLIWNVTLRDHLKDLHIASYAIGRSGQWSAITPRDWGRHVSATLRTQYGFLRQFAQELHDLSGTSLAKLSARVGLYAASARQSFERGMVAELGIDAVVLPAYPGDGTSECHANCRCRWSIRIVSKARGDFNASWRLGRAEHCQTCRARARQLRNGGWQGLRIRGGILIDSPSPIFAR